MTTVGPSRSRKFQGLPISATGRPHRYDACATDGVDVVADHADGFTDDMVSIYTDDNGTKYTAFYCIDVPFSFKTVTTQGVFDFTIGTDEVITNAQERIAMVALPGRPPRLSRRRGRPRRDNLHGRDLGPVRLLHPLRLTSPPLAS